MKKKVGIALGTTVICIAAICAGFFALRNYFHKKDISENQCSYDNGDVIYIPKEKNLAYDADSYILYYDNLLSVYLLTDLSENEKQTLADSVDGEIVGDISGCINYVQIKVPETSFEELNDKVNLLNQSENVLYASFDTPMLINETAADSNPWSDDAARSEEHRGEEKNPDGNDWWAEAIGAYTAWEYVDSHKAELNPIKVGVIDDGFFTEHDELKDKIEILNGVNITNNAKEEVSAHGTAVSGIIAANNDDKGIRGIADGATLLCADYSLIGNDGKDIYLVNTGRYIEITKQLYEAGCRVINNSWGYSVISEKNYNKEAALKKNFFPNPNRYEYIPSYDEYVESVRNGAIVQNVQLAAMIAELYADAKKNHTDFIIVQSAGNGYDNEMKEGYDLEQLGTFYAAVRDTISSESMGVKVPGVPLDISEGRLTNPLIPYSRVETFKERLISLGITYDEIPSHVLIVGGTKKKMNLKNKQYKMSSGSNYGADVDICAPGEEIFVCGTVKNGISRYNSNWSGTSLSAPMVSGAAALLWQINPDLSAAAVRDLLLKSNQSAIGVGADEGTIYPMLNIGESVKKLTGWSNFANIQEGLYIVPGTQNILYVEQDEDEISFTAWWFKLASIEETAVLKGSDAEFVCGEESTGQTYGKLHFDTAKAILTLDENRFSYLNEQTEYSWLRESMWELSEEQLQEVGQALRVPVNLNVEYTQDEAYYWEAGGRYATYVQILYDNNVIATATVDSFTGELIKDIMMYSNSSLQFSDENIPSEAIEKYDHYYYIFDAADVTSGQTATEFCKERGGYLAAVTSEEENEFLFNYMIESGYHNAYFGFSDFGKEGNWQWLNGEEVSFTNWHDGEPNGGQSENYAMFYDKYPDGTWNDGGCANSNGEVFICEWE